MKDDDLFADSTMSFGEHLEELRKCLIYCIYSIALGTCAGFLFGMPAVKYIQIPVEQSLAKYHIAKSETRLRAELAASQNQGFSREILDVSGKYRLVVEKRYLFPGEIERALNYQPMTGDNLSAPRPAIPRTTHYEEKPIPIFFFREVDDLTSTKSLNTYEPFGMYLKASLIIGIIFASPFVAYHLWAFVAAGLYPHEKKYVYYYIPVSITLFIVGAVFAFFFVFQYVLDFLFRFNSWMNIEPDPRISEWVGFAMLLPIGFGLSFQLPVVMFVLERVGIFSLKQYLASWRLSVFVIWVLAMLLTPGDPGSMILMSVSLTILYFGGILSCWLFPRKKGIFDFDDEDVVAEGE